MRQDILQSLLSHPQVRISQLHELAKEIPELAEQIYAHELPSVQTIVEELLNS